MDSLRPVLTCPRKISTMHSGQSIVNRTCLNPICQGFLQWVTFVVAVSNVLHQQWGKDQSRSHLFIKYSENRNFSNLTEYFHTFLWSSHTESDLTLPEAQHSLVLVLRLQARRGKDSIERL